MQARWFFVISFLVLAGAGCASEPPVPVDVTPNTAVNTPTLTFPGILPDERIMNKQARITTAKGDVVFALYADTAPMAVSNFVALAESGYYDGLTFHRRESWVLQGGDPLGTGRGGPGYKFPDELNDDHTYTRGTLAMANSGANTNGSQFFVYTIEEMIIAKAYTIFGTVTEGMDVVDLLGKGDVMEKVVIEEAGE